MIKSQTMGVGQELTERGKRELFMGYGNGLCIDRNLGYMDVCICPKSSNGNT